MDARQIIGDAAALTAGLVAPPRCAICAAACSWRERLCPGCAAALSAAIPVTTPSHGLDAAWSAAPYAGVPRELVAALKFARRAQLARVAAERIAATAPAAALEGVVVPVPAAPARLRARGLDAAEEIAIALAELTDAPLMPCLGRADGPRQAGRGRSQRLADPPRVGVHPPVPAAALLVDDVITTGATLAACAAALRATGSSRVAAVSFARRL